MKKSCFHLILAIALAGGNLMAEDNAAIPQKETAPPAATAAKTDATGDKQAAKDTKATPIPEGVSETFAKMDANNDKKVTKEEFVAFQVTRKGPKIKAAAETRFVAIAKGKDSFNLDEFAVHKQSERKK